MSSILDRAKNFIKQCIRESSANEINIPIENIEENVTIFNKALKASDIQRMLLQQNKSVRFHLIESGIEQAKRHMLRYIRGAGSHVRQIIFPCLQQDATDYHAALRSEEVKACLERRNLTATIRTVNTYGQLVPDIVIATVDDVASGKLDEFLK